MSSNSTDLDEMQAEYYVDEGVRNNNVVLIFGYPDSGKSFSLRTARKKSLMLINGDLKKPDYPAVFGGMHYVKEPYDVFDAIAAAEESDEIETVAIDTITKIMESFEVEDIGSADDVFGAWRDYYAFHFGLNKEIQLGYKNYVVLAHMRETIDQNTKTRKVEIPVSGKLAHIGIAANYSISLQAEVMDVDELKKHPNDMLHITPEEEEDGIKYVFITRKTKRTLGAPIRTPHGMFSREELYIDNDIQQLFDRIEEFYEDDEEYED